MLIVSMRDRKVLRRAIDGSLVEHADLSGLAPWHVNDMLVDRDGCAWVGNFAFDLVLVADSLTHYWQELLRSVRGERKRLDIKLIGEAEERWSEFTENYGRALIHYLCSSCPRSLKKQPPWTRRCTL
jgi:hypothetical protein